MAGDEEVPDDKLEEVNFALVDFFLFEVQLNQLLDVENYDGAVFGIPACQVVDASFLK